MEQAYGEEAFAKLGTPYDENFFLYRGKGCEVCNGSGYKGRVGLYEILVMDDVMRKGLSETISEYDIRKLAVAQGMVSMLQDGCLKVFEGTTTIEEVLRVAGLQD